ncbi:MAG: peptidoglycan-binding protein [Candidatus Sungbacteria bacterium]|nr:peptidoglycan-binding protein [Candidatus Sungbacteria bacterium]
MRIFVFTLFFLFGLVAFWNPLQAAELYINTDGRVQINNAEITYLNNNFVTVTLWSTRWVLFVDVADSNVKVTNAGGEPITIWDLAKGHTIYVEGRTRDAGPGKIEINVELLRDLSIQGSKQAVLVPAIVPLKPTTVIIPSPQVPFVQESSLPAVPVAKATLDETAGVDLKRGARGGEVRVLQSTLLSQGYVKDDEVTGFFGPSTERAVKKFQADNGLEQVGYVGPRTKQVLESLTGKLAAPSDGLVNAVTPSGAGQADGSIAGRLTRRLDIGMRGSEVVLLQEFLQKNNWGIPNDGPVTGYYGKATAKAVVNFQKANNLEPVGFVGQETRVLINKFLAEGTGSVPVVAGFGKEAVPVAAGETPAAGGKQKITKILQRGMRGEEVKILQEFLQKSDSGIPDDGPVTGYYGSVTVRAVTKFQQANGLEAVGFVGPATRELINKLLGE